MDLIKLNSRRRTPFRICYVIERTIHLKHASRASSQMIHDRRPLPRRLSKLMLIPLCAFVALKIGNSVG
jgi:hypothetical protein